MATLTRRKPSEFKFLVPNDTLTSGIAKSNAALPIVASITHYGDPVTHVYRSKVITNTLTHSISADAAEGFGEHIFTFPLGLIKPLHAYVKLTSLCATGLSATAGEVALGSTIATGAIATMGAGSAAMENIMEGTTLSNHVAATTLVSHKYNDPVVGGTHSATAGSGAVLDGSGTAKKCHVNICSTFDQTAAELFSFSAEIHLTWAWVGAGA